jgi:2-C-methyl-D-erythritol 4-phosphate cytidylyltransferase / 2-C-methyl-D-erythritol 2,4-cyclodiphosphate synthase
VSTWGIVVAAGRGARFGGAKQYERLGDRRIVDWSLAAARRACDGVVLVVAAERVADAEPDADLVVAGGETRSESVRAGLHAVPGDADVVVVHDAARPLASDALFTAVLDAVRAGADGAVPCLPVIDTVKRLDGGRVVGTEDRSTLGLVQTPQAFRAATLRAAHATGADATDDAALVEAAGGTVVAVAGEAANAKITSTDDLARVSGAGPAGHRVGFGFDVHPFADDRPLVLGGVSFPGERGLAGHSDSDVVAHAVADALLGAAGLGDIGEHFPDTDPDLAGADSIALLTAVVDLVRARGWCPVNVDCSVVLEAPKLAPRRAELQARLSAAVGAPVSVKAKRAEGLGALGRGEGVACWAVALLERAVDQR